MRKVASIQAPAGRIVTGVLLPAEQVVKWSEVQKEVRRKHIDRGHEIALIETHPDGRTKIDGLALRYDLSACMQAKAAEQSA